PLRGTRLLLAVSYGGPFSQLENAVDLHRRPRLALARRVAVGVQLVGDFLQGQPLPLVGEQFGEQVAVVVAGLLAAETGRIACRLYGSLEAGYRPGHVRLARAVAKLAIGSLL